MTGDRYLSKILSFESLAPRQIAWNDNSFMADVVTLNPFKVNVETELLESRYEI